MNLRLKVLDLIKKHGYPKEDVRTYVLNTISWALTFALIRFNIYLTLKHEKIPHDISTKLIGIENWDLKLLETDVKFTRIGFLTFIQFHIENFLKIILSNLEENNPPKYYYNLVERILKVLKIKDFEDKLAELNVLAYMRNCLHSNGVHTNPSKTFEIDDHKFEFEKGKKCKNTSWPEIILALDHSINIIDEILQNKQIINIKKQLDVSYIPK